MDRSDARRRYYSQGPTTRIAGNTPSSRRRSASGGWPACSKPPASTSRSSIRTAASGTPQRALERELLRDAWDVIGISTTGMTLRFDLELAHLARRLAPQALLVAGGMEATFRPELMFELGPVRSGRAGRRRASAARAGRAPALRAAARRHQRHSRAQRRRLDSATAAGRARSRRAARRDLQHALRENALRGLLGAARSGLSRRRAADARRRAKRSWPRSARCA